MRIYLTTLNSSHQSQQSYNFQSWTFYYGPKKVLLHIYSETKPVWKPTGKNDKHIGKQFSNECNNHHHYYKTMLLALPIIVLCTMYNTIKIKEQDLIAQNLVLNLYHIFRQLKDHHLYSFLVLCIRQ